MEIKPYVEKMMYGFCPITETDKKVFKCLTETVKRIGDIALVSEPTKENFDKLWNENWLYVYSSKYKHRVHNSAALLYEDRVLIPYGREKGFLKSGPSSSNDQKKG